MKIAAGRVHQGRLLFSAHKRTNRLGGTYGNRAHVEPPTNLDDLVDKPLDFAGGLAGLAVGPLDLHVGT